MTPEKWSGIRKFMLVWNFNIDTMPQQREVVEWYKNEHGYVIWRDVYNTYWNYCAEIPKEAPDYSIDDLIKMITKRCEDTSWFPADSCIVEYLKSHKELKEENEKLKDKVNELKNSCSYLTHCGMCNTIAKLEEKIANLKKENEELKEKNMLVDETDEYTINSREEYDAVIAKIKAHFDEEDKCGEYDIASSVEEEKQYHKASLAYIKYLEEKICQKRNLEE